jgi:OmcA/MtrC family decaheme c-type cytochrome
LLLLLAAACSGDNGADGADGADGTSCTVTDNGDGTKTIECEDGTSVTVEDGTDGDSCTVVDNGDGTKTISCDDGTSVTVSDGTDGQDGQDVTIVANEACAVCHKAGAVEDVEAVHVGALDKIDITDDVVITDVRVDTSGGIFFEIDFDWTVGITDQYGNFTPIDPFTPRSSNPAQLDYIRFFIAQLVPGQNGSPDTWAAYAAGERDITSLSYNGGDSYTYRFATDYTADYDETLTHRAGIQVYHLDGFKVVNPLYDFVPDGVTAQRSHEVVNVDSCNECHDSLGFHGGGRVETGMCVMCHNEDRPSVDLPVMVHKIHAAKAWDDKDFTEVTYPQAVNNCMKCHNGADAATPEGDNWKLVPNRKACGACHDDVNFATGDNHPSPGGIRTDDSECTVCHGETFIVDVHQTLDPTPNNPGFPSELSAITYELTEARVTGTTLEVDFKIFRDGTELDLLNLPTDLTTADRYPSFLTAWAMPQGGIDTPVDYNNLGNSGGAASSFDLGDLITNSNVAAAGSGLFTATIANAYPTGAKMRAVALQGYFQQTADIGNGSENIARHTRSAAIDVTGDNARRDVVDITKCQSCHDSLALHGGNRVDNVRVCVQCHTPSLTSSGRTIDPSGGLPTEITDILGTDPLVWPEEPMNFKELVHGIHSSELRERDFEFVRNFRGGRYFNWNEVTFPGVLQNCESCHLPDTYQGDLPAGVLPTTYEVVGTDRTDILAKRDSVPNGTDLAGSPTASACYNCHASAPVESHIEGNGGIIRELRSLADLD